MINFKSGRVWLKAVRAPFFTATIVPVALGSIIAWYDTASFAWLKFALAMAGALLIHAGTNLANDYFDHRAGCDEANTNPTPFSGGSRVIQEGLISAKEILYASLASFILGAGIGLYLNYLCGNNVILFLGVTGIFLGFFYTAGPLRIGYGSFGELAVGFGFGPLMVMGAYYVQAKALPLKVFLTSIPIGILVALILFINEFPDRRSDRSVGKKTLVVLLGGQKAMILYNVLLAAAYLVIAALVVFKLLPAAALIVFFTLPLAIKAFTVSKNNFDKIYEMLPANASTIALHSATGLLLCAAFMLDKIFR